MAQCQVTLSDSQPRSGCSLLSPEPVICFTCPGEKLLPRKLLQLHAFLAVCLCLYACVLACVHVRNRVSSRGCYLFKRKSTSVTGIITHSTEGVNHCLKVQGCCCCLFLYVLTHAICISFATLQSGHSPCETPNQQLPCNWCLNSVTRRLC